MFYQSRRKVADEFMIYIFVPGVAGGYLWYYQCKKQRGVHPRCFSIHPVEYAGYGYWDR